MLAKDYDFSDPADVREVYETASWELKMLLSMVYEHNYFTNKGNSLLKIGVNTAEDPNDWIKLEDCRSKRSQLRRKITEASKFYGLTAQGRGLNCLISYVKRRHVKRNLPRPTGSIVNITLKNLYVFAGLWDKAGRPNLINRAMLGE